MYTFREFKHYRNLKFSFKTLDQGKRLTTNLRAFHEITLFSFAFFSLKQDFDSEKKANRSVNFVSPPPKIGDFFEGVMVVVCVCVCVWGGSQILSFSISTKYCLHILKSIFWICTTSYILDVLFCRVKKSEKWSKRTFFILRYSSPLLPPSNSIGQNPMASQIFF